MEKITLTRKDLYELVWSSPLTLLAKKYNISDTGLRKICNKLEIPLPKGGHWNKLKFGKKVSVRPLPDKSDLEQPINLMLREPGVGILSPLTLLRQEIEEKHKSELRVPTRLTSPEALVIAAKQSLEKGDRWSHISLRNDGIVYSNAGLSIKVAPSNTARALRFLDTIIKLFRSRGHDVQGSSVVVQGRKCEFSLREKLVKMEGGSYTRHRPTGIFCFKVDSYTTQETYDGKEKIENKLSFIVAKLELDIRALLEAQEYNQRMHDARLEAERLVRAHEERKEKELTDFRDLLARAYRQFEAGLLRNYIDHTEEQAWKKGAMRDELQKWLDWARKKADWYDPHIELEDELLKDVDKQKLVMRKK